jgi:hypothetical protein
MRRHSVDAMMPRHTAVPAAVAIAAGLFANALPAHAGPPGCEGFALPGVVNINISDGTSMTFNGGGTSINAPTEIGGTPGAVQGTVDPNTGRVDFHFIHGANDDRHFAGNAFDDGKVSGDVQPAGLSWSTTAPLTCTKQVALPGPDVTGEPVLGGIVIHVTDHSGKTSRCHYDSEVYDRDFTLNASSTADVNLVPAVPLFRAWPVTVTCDNGTRTDTTIDF